MALSLADSIRATRAYNQSLGLRLSESPPPRQTRCHYCPHRPGTTDDHIVPKTLGGSNRQANIVRACKKCNGTKGDAWPTCPCPRCAIARRLFLAQRVATNIATLTREGLGSTSDEARAETSH